VLYAYIHYFCTELALCLAFLVLHLKGSVSDEGG